MKRLIPLALCAACTASGPPQPLPPAEDTCGAGQYADLVGQDATALERVLIMGMVRVIRPGDMVTMDYWPDRINFAIAADNTIDAVTCG